MEPQTDEDEELGGGSRSGQVAAVDSGSFRLFSSERQRPRGGMWAGNHGGILSQEGRGVGFEVGNGPTPAALPATPPESGYVCGFTETPRSGAR